MDVKTYIELLKSNRYDSADLPELSYKDIPELLAHRNDTQIISHYPHKPISSYHYPECKLGIYALWTIESIRAVSIHHVNLVKRFPSQNPILKKRNLDKLVFEKDYASQWIAAKAYYDWWENHKNQGFEAFNGIDPLVGTEYIWH